MKLKMCNVPLISTQSCTQFSSSFSVDAHLPPLTGDHLDQDRLKCYSSPSPRLLCEVESWLVPVISVQTLRCKSKIDSPRREKAVKEKPAMGIEAWYMDDSDDDQRKAHKRQPSVAVTLQELEKLGVLYWKLDPDKSEDDPELQKIRKERNYSWMDIVNLHKDTMPNYEEKIKSFYQEHIHLDEEIRYILAGSGYFDVRDKDDKWIRIAMKKGDMITLPAGIYHRFTLDENNYVKAMRLFVGEPVWTPHYRPADEFEARKKYVQFLNEGF